MSREIDRTEQLRQEFITAIVGETGMREVLAVPLADSLVAYLQREYGGSRLYIPAPARMYPMLQLEAELRRGEPQADVCRRYNISHRTLKRLFPGGIPRPEEPETEVA
jgi:Mor family transcriptional regulator